MQISPNAGKQDKDFWNDYVSIFLKDKNYLDEYPNKIINTNINDFYNGKVYNSDELYNATIRTEDQIYKHLKYISKTEYLMYRAINKFLRFVTKVLGLKNHN